MLLQGRIAIITGGGRGIGRAIALRYAAEGAAVVVAARTQAEVESVAAEIGKAGGRAAAVAADVSQVADCDRVVASAREKFGAVHILVNNAGFYWPVEEVQALAVEDWDKTMAVNLRSAFLLTRLVLPEMYARGSGVILNISSVSGKNAHPFGAHYMASKAGMLGLTRGVAAESARRGVRVNAICPGPVIETQMSRELGPAFGKKFGVSAEEQLQALVERILQGRAQTCDEIAEAALFLASDKASAITGQTINVDGGMVFC